MARKYAIIETDGKNHTVAEGMVIHTDAIHAEVGSVVTFEKVLLLSTGSQVVLGAPTVAGASVTGTVLSQEKDKKILVFKYKPKKRVRKLFGHRQRFASIKIDSISA
jgi:large subunit ribosomal protein L21